MNTGSLEQSNIPQAFRDARLGADLLWRELRSGRFRTPVPALFLDRDGVIIIEKGYIRNPDDVELLPGIVELIQAARAAGMAIVEITNQAGIARAYSGWLEFTQVEDRLKEALQKQQTHLDAVFACPFHPQGLGAYRVADHPWRKPNPGMLLEAAKLLNLDLSASMLVGDNVSDQQAARDAGLSLGVHVLTGHGTAHQEACRSLTTEMFPVHIVAGAAEAIPLLRMHARHGRNHNQAEFNALDSGMEGI